MTALVVGGSVQHERGGWTGEARYADRNRIGNTNYELATAARYVAEARRIVMRQRARVARFRALARSTLDQELTLRAFVSTLAILESSAQELADIAKRFELPQRKLS